MIKNIMSVDLEDHYCNLPYEEWEKHDSKVEQNTEIILNLFEKYDVKATFFTVAQIAKMHPNLIEKIVAQGHEIASHSFFHIDLRTMDKNSFEQDLKESIYTLENISGDKILGYRAPYYSINQKNFWAYDIMRKYLKYDSSIFPVKTPLYGIPHAPRFPYFMSDTNPLKQNESDSFLEIPPATYHMPLIGNIPIAGGFHLRVLPLFLIKRGIRKLNKNNIPSMCYIHPHDLDPQRPKIDANPNRAYWGIKKASRKFESLLKDFRFTSVREVFFNN